MLLAFFLFGGGAVVCSGVIGDFKQRGQGGRRGPQALRKYPNNHLRMIGGKKLDVLHSAPT